MEGFPIDAVITWVDGNDPAHRAKRKAFLTDKAEDRSDDIGGATRFSSSGEIFFCIGSILRFAPFVRKIFIVTDCQDPHTDDFIHRNFPDTGTEVEATSSISRLSTAFPSRQCCTASRDFRSISYISMTTCS